MPLPLPAEPIVFIDLETTGANFANDRIIEIGCVEVDQDGVREWSSLIDPGVEVSDFITGLTGIDTAMVQGAPRFEQLAPQILERLRGRLFIAHNARFDYTFLKREFKRVGVDFRASSLCTVKLSRKLFAEHHRHSLDALLERYAIEVGDRHRALADAQVLWALWQRWHKLLPEPTIRQAIDAIVGRPQLPAHIDPSLADDLPEAPGAYALYTADGTLLLAKRCGNLRQQVLAHFSAAHRETAISRHTARVEWREAAGEVGARLHELAFSASARKPPEALCSWQLVRHGEGDYRPQLVYADATDFARTPELYGLYDSARDAVHTLRKLAEAHHLCHGQLGLGNTKAGSACVAFKQRSCRGACVGKEPLSLHSARLMSALAKYKINTWPYAGPVALVERDEFGMREDFHLVDGWRLLATVHDEAALNDELEQGSGRAQNGAALAETGFGFRFGFDPDLYRVLGKFIASGKVRVVALGAPDRG